MKYRSIANGSVYNDVPLRLVGVLYEEIPEGVPEDSVPPPGLFYGPPVKRRRGRPRKHPLPETEE